MYHKITHGNSFLNRKEYCDKLLGCWYGKNIGGTLGAPFEGKRQFNNLSFYTQDLKGNPIPNDDLDLQLIWLRACEDCGVYNVNEQVLGEYWLGFITLPANEYMVGSGNIRQGFFPPLSGAIGNDRWKNSNGAWIRSEIWACIFPGALDEASRFAWFDSCVDHCGEGIYAEIFTACLESAAFIESDREKIIELALARIPADCRVARSVRMVIEEYHKGTDWKVLRDMLVEDSKDLGWFMAPANVAFAVLGLIYGEGDFGKSICLAVNCGDDTDCTGATCGSVLGILLGRSGIPQKWIDPIGDAIQTISFEQYQSYVPKTLTELAKRVCACKEYADATNPTLFRLHDGPTVIAPEDSPENFNQKRHFNRVLGVPSLSFRREYSFGRLTIEYDKVPEAEPGDTFNLKLLLDTKFLEIRRIKYTLELPEGWSSPMPEAEVFLYKRRAMERNFTVTVGDFKGLFYLQLKIMIDNRDYPTYVNIPFRRKGALGDVKDLIVTNDQWDDFDQARARSSLVTDFE